MIYMVFIPYILTTTNASNLIPPQNHHLQHPFIPSRKAQEGFSYPNHIISH